MAFTPRFGESNRVYIGIHIGYKGELLDICTV